MHVFYSKEEFVTPSPQLHEGHLHIHHEELCQERIMRNELRGTYSLQELQINLTEYFYTLIKLRTLGDRRLLVYNLWVFRCYCATTPGSFTSSLLPGINWLSYKTERTIIIQDIGVNSKRLHTCLV